MFIREKFNQNSGNFRTYSKVFSGYTASSNLMATCVTFSDLTGKNCEMLVKGTAENFLLKNLFLYSDDFPFIKAFFWNTTLRTSTFTVTYLLNVLELLSGCFNSHLHIANRVFPASTKCAIFSIRCFYLLLLPVQYSDINLRIIVMYEPLHCYHLFYLFCFLLTLNYRRYEL